MFPILSRLTRPFRTITRATIFFLKVFPMIPSRAVDWVNPAPVVERVRYPTLTGEVECDLYRPSTSGPYPGILVCLGVVPFEVDHPQVPILGKALARAGFAALLYWSPAMRRFTLSPEDIENLPLAYRWLIDQPYVDPARSGLLGTCVGSSFALMSAADPLIRSQVAFIGAYAPFSSMWTFARDIASDSRVSGPASGGDTAPREPWKVDQLTRKVFLHSITATLEPAEAEWIRAAFASSKAPRDDRALSADGGAVCALLTAPDSQAADAALNRLPPGMQHRLNIMSPMQYIDGLRTPLIVHFHDRGDMVIPVSESRNLRVALAGKIAEYHYTEMNFSHLDPVKGRLPLARLLRELARFYRALYPLFWKTTRA